MLDSKKRQIELHKRIAASYKTRYTTDISKIYQDYQNNDLIKGIPEDPDLKILDCGCGIGVLLTYLKKLYKNNVFGVDLSIDMLNLLDDQDRRCVSIADAEELPFGNDVFDVVFCRGILHHVPFSSKTLEEVYRSLKPNGVLVVAEPCNDIALVRFIRRIMYRKSDKFETDEHPFFSSELEDLVKESGLDIKNKRYFGYIAYSLAGFIDILPVLRYLPFNHKITRLLIEIDKLLTKIPLVNRCGLHFIVMAQKPAPARRRADRQTTKDDTEKKTEELKV